MICLDNCLLKKYKNIMYTCIQQNHKLFKIIISIYNINKTDELAYI